MKDINFNLLLNKKYSSYALIVVFVAMLVFAWASFAYARFIETHDHPITLNVTSTPPTKNITYNPNQVDSPGGSTVVQGSFTSGEPGPIEKSQEINKLYNVPTIGDTSQVDNPVANDPDYVFDCWYAFNDSDEIVEYRNLNSTICDDFNWPKGDTFYAKYKQTMTITFMSGTGKYSDGTTSKDVLQTVGQRFSTPSSNPIWNVPDVSSSEQPVFAYWYEIDETGQHVDWTTKLQSTVSTDNMPNNNALYAEWQSSGVFVEFDAQENQGGYWPDNSNETTAILVKQTHGSNFVLPADPSNHKAATFLHWNTNRNRDDVSSRIDATTVVDSSIHNHIRVYAHYDMEVHRITLMVANPETGGQFSYKDPETGETVTTTQAFFDVQNRVSGNKLNYSLTSTTTSGTYKGLATFTRAGAKEFELESVASSTSKFSKFEITEDASGIFPGWDGTVNGDITIKLYFVPSTYQPYFIYNKTENPMTIAGKTIKRKELIFFYDDLLGTPEAPGPVAQEINEILKKKGSDYKSPDIMYSWKIVTDSSGKNSPQPNPIETHPVTDVDWRFTQPGQSYSPVRDSAEIVTVDPSFHYFPISSTTNMFNKLYNLKNQPEVSNINFFNVTEMKDMFNSCTRLTSCDLSSWGVRNCTEASGMFNGCQSLTWINVSNWDMTGCNCNNMFNGCQKLAHIYVAGADVDWSGASSGQGMFSGCGALHNIGGFAWSSSLANAHCQDETDTTQSHNPGAFETWKG